MRHAVILAGGSGTRLWPASRQSRAKQFLTLDGARTLLGATAWRLRAVVDHTVIVTAAEQQGACTADVPSATLIAEPLPRNTAAALGLAAVHVAHQDDRAVIGAFPADHHIADEAGFAVVVERAFAAATTDDVICTIGIAPTHAETGFGYLELGSARTGLGAHVRDVIRFVEKPNLATAAQYVASGNYMWNGGMFFVRATYLLDEIERLLPPTGAGLREIARALRQGPDAATKATAAVYPGLPSVSIDHGVMERTTAVVAVPGSFGWSDVGSWQAIATLRPKNEHDNATIGDQIAIDAAGNFTMTDVGVIAVVGVSGLAVVRSGDAVLVIPLERAQDTRAVVAALGTPELRTLPVKDAMDDSDAQRTKDPAKARRAAADPKRPGEHCKAEPGHYRPVIDHARCEGKRDCVQVCPYGVFEVRRIDDVDFARLGLLGKLKSIAHKRMSAYAPAADACHACGLCVVSCPEQAITLVALR